MYVFVMSNFSASVDQFMFFCVCINNTSFIYHVGGQIWRVLPSGSLSTVSMVALCDDMLGNHMNILMLKKEPP